MPQREESNFKELLGFTLCGYGFGIFFGVFFDWLKYPRYWFTEWLVRVFSGEGESIFEGVFSIRQRFLKKKSSFAEAYGWGKFLGIFFPWFVDWLSRFAGVDMYASESFYVPYFYAMSDQIGANIAGFIFFYKQEKSIPKALLSYRKNPVMLASLLVILVVPVGLFLVRSAGFHPTRQVFVACETIAANLCWVPALIGFFQEKKNLLKEKPHAFPR